MSLDDTPLVGPVVALLVWTTVVGLWLLVYRLTDVVARKVPLPQGMTMAQFNAHIPRHRQFPADNFNHLHEQPTCFYAAALALALLGVRDNWAVGCAWAYVGARVVHSLVQINGNVIRIRFAVFMISNLFLQGMVSRAVMACWER